MIREYIGLYSEGYPINKTFQLKHQSYTHLSQLNLPTIYNMALFEKGLEEKDNEFPTLPAFLVRVEVRDVPSMGDGHKGIFTLEKLAAQTKIWKWTKRIQVIPQSELETYIQNNYDIEKELESIRIFLRQERPRLYCFVV